MNKLKKGACLMKATEKVMIICSRPTVIYHDNRLISKIRLLLVDEAVALSTTRTDGVRSRDQLNGARGR